jgi:adenylate cyclase
VIGTAGATGVELATGVRERRRIERSFAKFAPEPIVKQLMARGEGESIPGKEQEASVLFCDLRGFTQFSSEVTPEQVLQVLNRYHAAMSDTILDHGGTIASIMGDGLMAVFGAPVEQEDHADRAVAAARELSGPRLDAFNAGQRALGIREFAMGVGVMTGPVQSGTVGTRRRLDYAAVGDTTNAASRLQGATKSRDVPVLISETTILAMTRAREGLRELGAVELPGRAAVVAWTFDG